MIWLLVTIVVAITLVALHWVLLEGNDNSWF